MDDFSEITRDRMLRALATNTRVSHVNLDCNEELGARLRERVKAAAEDPFARTLALFERVAADDASLPTELRLEDSDLARLRLFC